MRVFPSGTVTRSTMPLGNARMEVADRQRDMAHGKGRRGRCPSHVLEDDDRWCAMDVQRPSNGEHARRGGLQRQQDGEHPHEEPAEPVQ